MGEGIIVAVDPAETQTELEAEGYIKLRNGDWD